ncbi:hypothetical protein PLIIFM63780_009072 [Purpureocillium lilacinum]|nr:hypothetical protein PLIIFM63780_009072 [Purpureocillium lilacinum]
MKIIGHQNSATNLKHTRSACPVGDADANSATRNTSGTYFAQQRQPCSETRKRASTECSGPPRISKPVELILPSYDCVVIGSGYGGGVAASRMARAGQSVCLLEKGREKWPGEYPVSFGEISKEFHVSGRFKAGPVTLHDVDNHKDTGLYHLMFGHDQSVFVCNGLGGGSLLNGNIFLETTKEVLAMPSWPKEIRDNPGCLSEYYDMVRDVLEPEAYPANWPELRKMKVFESQAKSLGLGQKFIRAPQTTRFRSGPNSTGVNMSASTSSGQDCTGVNDWSKSSTLVTYLADAWNWGAELFCECEARYIEKVQDERGGYIVYFAWHGRNRQQFSHNFRSELMWVYAKNAVFLGGGAMGTTELLLRSRDMGLRMSDQVGRNMSGNGNILAFGYNSRSEVNAVGSERPSRFNAVGPTITSMIDCRGGHANPLDGFVVQDGAIPQGLGAFFQILLQFLPAFQSGYGRTFTQRLHAIMAWLKGILMGCFFNTGALHRTQAFVAMLHDSNQGSLCLENDKPVFNFAGAGRNDRVRKVHAFLSKISEAIGAVGAGMTSDGSGARGVTNHVGEVFVGNATAETYPGLVVTDAAAIPRALGVNPLATITALAERAVANYAAQNGLVIEKTRNGILDLYEKPPICRSEQIFPEGGTVEPLVASLCDAVGQREPTVSFTELMSGVTVPCSEADTAGTDYPGIMTGTFTCPSLRGSPFTILRSKFGVFESDDSVSGSGKLVYDFEMLGVNGKRLHFHGYKVTDPSITLRPSRLWQATTTLYVSITDPGMDPGQTTDKAMIAARTTTASPRCIVTNQMNGPYLRPHRSPIAMGIINVHFADLLPAARTLTASGANFVDRAAKLSTYLERLWRQPLQLFLTPFMPLQYPLDEQVGCINFTPPSRTFTVVASDGVASKLHMWEPDPCAVARDEHGAPVPVKDLFMIPGASVDHQIFALATIPFNAVNYLTRAGYRVFVTVHRIGRLETAHSSWTTYDARLDIKACLEIIRTLHGRQKIYTIAHCMGSVAFACGLLDGTIPAEWILGITCSQVFMNPVWSTVNTLKAKSPIPLDWLFSKLAGPFFDCSTSVDDKLVHQVLNQFLRLYPQERHEMCNNAVCLRTTFLFGRCWSHHNLNEATHSQIDRVFGGANVNLMHLLMHMGTRGAVTSNAPAYEPLVTPENIQRLRGIPFLLFNGADSSVLSPKAADETYNTLLATFGVSAGVDGAGVQYRRRSVEGYGHLDCWMGVNAWRDVYPFVREEVDRVVRGDEYVFRQPNDRFTAMVEAEKQLN